MSLQSIMCVEGHGKSIIKAVVTKNKRREILNDDSRKQIQEVSWKGSKDMEWIFLFVYFFTF